MGLPPDERSSHDVANRRSTYPRFPVKLGGISELHAAFLNESRIRGHLVALRSRKSGFGRDDKGEGGASIRIGCWLSELQIPPLRSA